MVNADDAQRRALGATVQSDRHGGLVESGGDVVDGDGVVRVGPVYCGTFAISYLLARTQITVISTYVSALTSQTTDRVRFGDVRLSMLTKGGILEDR